MGNDSRVIRTAPRRYTWSSSRIEQRRQEAQSARMREGARRLLRKYPTLQERSELAELLIHEFGVNTTAKDWADVGQYATTRKRLLSIFGLGKVGVGVILKTLDTAGITYTKDPPVDLLTQEIERVNRARSRAIDAVMKLGGVIHWGDVTPIAQARIDRRHQRLPDE